MADNHGFGTKLTFNSGFCSQIRDNNWSGITRGSQDESSQDSDEAMDFCPDSLYDPGEISIDGLHKDSMDPTTVVNAAAEPITVEFPSGAKLSAQGFLTNFQIGAPYNGLKSYKATLKMSGKITFTAAGA